MYYELDLLIEDAKGGCERSKNIIVNRFRPLILASIKKYCPIFREFEDLYADGVLIVLQCIENYNYKAKFPAYVKAYLGYYYKESFCFLIGEQSVKELEEQDHPITEDEICRGILELEDMEELSEILATLTLRQRQIIDLYYREGLSLTEIAAFLKISRWTVVNIKRRAIEKLRRSYVDKQEADSF